MTRRRRILGIVLINFTVLGFGIVMLEVLFGAWFNPNRLNRLNLIREPLEYDVAGLYETRSPIINYSRDKYGLRGQYGGDPSRIDILTVGGSTTDQRYISDGSTWQDVLQEQCAAVGTPVAVANAGVDGQTTFGHIKNFEWWFPYIPGLRPKFILFYVGLNDFYADNETAFDAIDTQSGPVVTAIKEKSALWYLVRTIRGAYRARAVLRINHQKVDLSHVRWTAQPLQEDYGFIAPRLTAYAARLRTLVRLTRHLGAEPIFVTQPSRYFKWTNGGLQGRMEITDYAGRQINGVDYYHMMREFNGAMASVARETDVTLVDLAATSDWQDRDFYDFAHMTPTGARKVGLALFERLHARLHR